MACTCLQNPPKSLPRSLQEAPRSVPRASKIVLGASKVAEKISRAPKISKKNALGRILAALCVPQAQLSCFWEPLGRSQATFPAIWGACMALRTHFGAPFRRHSCTVPCMHNPQQKSSTPSEPPHSQEFPHYGAAVSRQRLQSAAPCVYAGSEAFEIKSELYAEL